MLHFAGNAVGYSGAMSMTELELLRTIRRSLPKVGGNSVVAGIGDDCSVVRGRSGEDLLYTTDLFVEGTHFERDTLPARWAGRKALARGLSDIAAMGGEPRVCLVSLALPDWAGSRWVNGFYRGLGELANETGTVVVGGDLSRADQLVCDIVVCGSAPRGSALRRDRAKPGDGLYVSGTLGGSALGLRTRGGASWRRHSRPEPRLRLGKYLRKRGWVTSAMDLSDGLSLDLHRLCEASRVSAVIDRPLPVFHGATLDDALNGGEDYELLLTLRKVTRIPRSFEGIPLTRIGTITEEASGGISFFGRRLKPGGWDPFRKKPGRD